MQELETPVAEAENGTSDALIDWQAEWDASRPVIEDMPDEELEIGHYVRVQKAITAEMDRIEANYRTMMRQLTSKREWFEQQYAGRAQVACRKMLKGKAKSFKTLYGVAGFRAVKPLLIVEDDVAVMDNVEAGRLPAEVIKMKVTHSIDKTALNAHFDSTGEIPVGCQLREASDEFYVR